MSHPTPASGTSTTSLKTMLDAPEHYAGNEASAWATGYNTCILGQRPLPEPTEAEKRAEMRAALGKELWHKQNELSMVNGEYRQLGQKRLALISQVSAIQLKLSALKQEIAENGDE